MEAQSKFTNLFIDPNKTSELFYDIMILISILFMGAGIVLCTTILWDLGLLLVGVGVALSMSILCYTIINSTDSSKKYIDSAEPDFMNTLEDRLDSGIYHIKSGEMHLKDETNLVMLSKSKVNWCLERVDSNNFLIYHKNGLATRFLCYDSENCLQIVESELPKLNFSFTFTQTTQDMYTISSSSNQYLVFEDGVVKLNKASETWRVVLVYQLKDDDELYLERF